MKFLSCHRTMISENVPGATKDFQQFTAEDFQMSKMSKDVLTTFEHFQWHLKGNSFSIFMIQLGPLSAFFRMFSGELNSIFIICH